VSSYVKSPPTTTAMQLPLSPPEPVLTNFSGPQLHESG
jgi:hypothetical protein